jgi:hypothetical protein
VSLNGAGSGDPLAEGYSSLGLSSNGNVCVWESYAPDFYGDANSNIDVFATACW